MASEAPVHNKEHPSVPTVAMYGFGGCGLNLARAFKDNERLSHFAFFDTSHTNSRRDEKVVIVGSGDGSGSNRKENAAEIERFIPSMTDDQIGLCDVSIVVFSLGGGSGSVGGPLLVQELARRKSRVVAIVVTDSSSPVTATNNLNTLKSLASIAQSKELYIPMVIISNDHAGTRGSANKAAKEQMANLLEILTQPVFEVDRNDRLNWLNPGKVLTTASAGIKLMRFDTETPSDPKIVVGAKSKQMVDTLLLLYNEDDEVDSIPQAYLKKEGFYDGEHRRILGTVSSDIAPVEEIIDRIEHMQTNASSQANITVTRLNGGTGGMVY